MPGLDAGTRTQVQPPQVSSPDASSDVGVGNAALAGQLLPGGPNACGPDLGDDLALTSVGLSFSLPAETALTSDWQQLQTTSATRVALNVSATGLTVSFSPPLEADMQWPVSNVEWSGLRYDFATASVSRVDATNSQMLIPLFQGNVVSAVTAFVLAAVRGTPLARPGYNPLTDCDVMGTLAAVQASIAAQGTTGSGGDLSPRNVTDFAVSASVSATQRIEAGTGDGQMALDGGARLSLRAELGGNGATIASGPPSVRALYLDSTGLVLSSRGSPVASIRSLRVARGGDVDVTSFEPLGTLAEVGAGESLLRLFGALIALESGDRRALNTSLNPDLTNGVAEARMERALSDAVRGLVREHHDAVPGLDLRTVLGVSP